MSVTIPETTRLRRGLKANLPATGALAEPFFCTDTGELFVWNGSAMVLVNTSAADLSAAISATEAYTDSSIATEVANRNTAIGVETSARGAAISGEATARASGDTSSIATAEGYTDSKIATEVTNRNTAIGVEAARAEAAEALLVPIGSPSGPIVVGNQTAATALANQNSQLLTLESNYWTGFVSAHDDWTIQARIGGGTNPAATALQIKYTGPATSQFLPIVGSQNLVVEIQSNTPATNVSNTWSPSLEFDGFYWDGSASQIDAWGFQNVLGTGANPVSAFGLCHIGTAGVTSFVLYPGTPASSGSGNTPAPSFQLTSNYWNGSLPKTSTWALTSVIGAGATPTSTLKITNDAGSSGAITLDLTNGATGMTVLVPTASALSNSTKAASTAYADAAVAVEKARALAAEGAEATRATTAEALAIPKTAIVDGVSAAGCLTKVLHVRTELAASAVDGAYGDSFTIPVSGVYEISAQLSLRTVSSSAWVIETACQFTGPLNAAPLLGLLNMVNGTMSSTQSVTMYLHAGDTVKTATFTSSGANTGGVFDAAFVIKRVA